MFHSRINHNLGAFFYICHEIIYTPLLNGTPTAKSVGIFYLLFAAKDLKNDSLKTE